MRTQPTFEITGVVKELYDPQTFGSGFTKREFVITTDEKFAQDIKFEVVKDNLSLLDGIRQGDTITVAFDVRGREWKGSYFVNLSAWRIRTEHGAKKAEESSTPPPADCNEDIDEDVPF